MQPRRRSLLELNTAVLLWAGTALFSKWIALPALEITAYRSVAAALALLAVLAWQRQSLRPQSRRDFWLLLGGGVTLGLHWVTYFQSMQVSTVAVGILALHTYPVMTALVEPALFKERLHGIDVLLGLVVLAGVAVLVPDFSLDSSITRGVLLGILSAACFAARNILTRPVVKTYGGGTVMLYQLIVTVVMLVPVAIFAGTPVDSRSVAQLAVLGIFFTALPHTLFTNSLRHLSAKTVGVISTLLPIYGTITAALLLGEVPAPRTIVGGVIILAAVTVETWRVLRRQS